MEVKSGQTELRMGKRRQVPDGSMGAISPEKGNCSRTRGKKSKKTFTGPQREKSHKKAFPSYANK